ncbi:MAG: DUF2634 domain-containing protein [Streptococcaceae bacterium]|jgi:hypothetical protein|nr:DUF2634 domain-containing protein [Streptococcaceae bacterium]
MDSTTTIDDVSSVISSRTYKVENGRILGMIDEVDAIRQAVYKILVTERFIFEIYSDQYGHDLNDLIGKEMPMVKTALGSVIKEAFQSDDRIDDVSIDEITQTDSNTLNVAIAVSSFFGAIQIKKEVSV